MKRFARGFGPKLTLALVSTLIFFGSAELLARVWYEPLRTHEKKIFEYDAEKWFRLKSGFTGEFVGKPVVTNSHGYRDSEITVEKREGVRRIVVLGDSVSFGHGVLAEEAYPERLEALLNQFDQGRYQVINTAAPGNAPHQEHVDLERSLKFAPDYAIVQLNLNDIIEPYRVRTHLGGTGIDYHGVADLPNYDHLLSRSSGLYLLLKDLFHRVRLKAASREGLQAEALTEERLTVRMLVDTPDAPQILEAWTYALDGLANIVATAKREKIPLAVIVTPFEFQFVDSRSEAFPQRRFENFARENGLVFVDFLPLLQERFISDRSRSREEFWSTYFLDHDHLTAEGHAWLAEILFETFSPASESPS
jgi:lysophospholipase L1-like esterase